MSADDDLLIPERSGRRQIKGEVGKGALEAHPGGDVEVKDKLLESLFDGSIVQLVIPDEGGAVGVEGGPGLSAQEVVVPDSVAREGALSPFPADSLALTDSLSLAADTTALAADSASTKKGLDAPVNYQATDSIVMTAGNWAYLYGEGDVKYQNIQLQSEIIPISSARMKTSLEPLISEYP